VLHRTGNWLIHGPAGYNAAGDRSGSSVKVQVCPYCARTKGDAYLELPPPRPDPAPNPVVINLRAKENLLRLELAVSSSPSNGLGSLITESSGEGCLIEVSYQR
jgi:hypothetical protein